MERLLARLERSFLGRIAIPNLTAFVVGGMAITFVLLYLRPELYPYLQLDPQLALKQPWRLVSYLFLPRTGSLYWILFSLYMTWLVGSNLEREWGSFKLNVYYLIGALGTTAAAWITGMPQGNVWLNTSLFFAFATLFPDFEIQLFFIVPIRVKWLAIGTALLLGWYCVEGDDGTRAAIAVAFANYLIFFGGHLWSLARGQQIQLSQAARRTKFRAPSREEEMEKAEERSCAICGKKQSDGADIRVCSCEKCGGPRTLCLEHARNH